MSLPLTYAIILTSSLLVYRPRRSTLRMNTGCGAPWKHT
jgi:hypothetical protein